MAAFNNPAEIPLPENHVEQNVFAFDEKTDTIKQHFFHRWALLSDNDNPLLFGMDGTSMRICLRHSGLPDTGSNVNLHIEGGDGPDQFILVNRANRSDGWFKKRFGSAIPGPFKSAEAACLGLLDVAGIVGGETDRIEEARTAFEARCDYARSLLDRETVHLNGRAVMESRTLCKRRIHIRRILGQMWRPGLTNASYGREAKEEVSVTVQWALPLFTLTRDRDSGDFVTRVAVSGTNMTHKWLHEVEAWRFLLKQVSKTIGTPESGLSGHEGLLYKKEIQAEIDKVNAAIRDGKDRVLTARI